MALIDFHCYVYLQIIFSYQITNMYMNYIRILFYFELLLCNYIHTCYILYLNVSARGISYVMQLLHLLFSFNCKHFNKLILLEKTSFAVKQTHHSDRKYHYLSLFDSTSPLLVSHVGLHPNVSQLRDTSRFTLSSWRNVYSCKISYIR